MANGNPATESVSISMQTALIKRLENTVSSMTSKNPRLSPRPSSASLPGKWLMTPISGSNYTTGRMMAANYENYKNVFII